MSNRIKVFLSILLPVFLCSYHIYAQEAVAEDLTFHRTANFAFRFIDVAASKNVTLDAYYSSDTHKYQLRFLLPLQADTTTFAEPLDLQVFRNALNEKYNAAAGNTGTSTIAITEDNVLKAFYWLYSIKAGKETQPKTGDLHFRHYAMVFANPDDATAIDAKTRETKLDNVENMMGRYRNKVSATENAFIAVIKDKIENDKNALSSHDTMLNRRIKLLEAFKFPDTTGVSQDRLAIQNSLEKMAEFTSLKKSIDTMTVVRSSLEDSALLRLMGQFTNPGFSDTNRITSKLGDPALGLFKAYQDAVAKFDEQEQKLFAEKIFPVKSVTLKIERGFIEDLHIGVANENGKVDYFDISVPIGMSSLYNFKTYYQMRLFIRKSQKMGYNDMIYLSDVLGEYDLVEELLTRDYSPGDTVINMLDPGKQPYITLKREKQISLFDSRIYTDLAGLDDRSPNGLVQIEVSRRFNFLTNRRQNGSFRGDVGLLNYITVYGTLSKIEDKLKRLPLQNAYVVQNNTIVSPNYVTNLDLRRYENASVEADVTPLLLNWKDGKSMFYLDLGLRYGHTAIMDSVKTLDNTGQLQYPTIKDNINFDGHTATLVLPRLRWEFISEKRVGFSMSYQYNYTMLFSDNRFKQVASEEKSDLSSFANERQARKSHQIDFDLHIITSHVDDDYIFFRSRFYIQQGDANKFFPQFQLGYRYNLVFRK